MASSPALLRKFLAYQRERFPLAVLVPTTLSVVLSSYAIASALTVVPHAPWKIALAAVAAVAYLFHMRTIDECRDRDHDTRYHGARPVQRGLISEDELRAIDRAGLALFAGIALACGPRTLLVGAAALLYSFIAGKEFFLGERIKRRFFTYNALNMMQAILLQAFVYFVFTHQWYRFPVLWLHMIFIFSNSVLIEFVRKIKLHEEESVGRDTYSWYFGFTGSLQVYGLVIIVSYLIFLSMMSVLHLIRNSTMGISAAFLLLLFATVAGHVARRNKASEAALHLSTLSLYIGLHLVIILSLRRS